MNLLPFCEKYVNHVINKKVTNDKINEHFKTQSLITIFFFSSDYVI